MLNFLLMDFTLDFSIKIIKVSIHKLEEFHGNQKMIINYYKLNQDLKMVMWQFLLLHQFIQEEKIFIQIQEEDINGGN